MYQNAKKMIGVKSKTKVQFEDFIGKLDSPNTMRIKIGRSTALKSKYCNELPKKLANWCDAYKFSENLAPVD